jgi:integrase
MTEINSTAASRKRKPRKSTPPKKPHKDFPLFASGNGLWCKKVLGKLQYFGSWKDDPKGVRALERWLEDKDALLAGRVPRSRAASNAPTLTDLIEKFLLAKALLRDNGERSPHTWNAYADVCDELIATFGQNRLLSDIMPEDFQKLRSRWAAKWGPTRLGAEINRARVVFNYAYKTRLVPTEFFYGEEFSRPSRKTMRLTRAAKGPKMFEAGELRRMIETATLPLKAMLLLGINGALGNADIARLPLSAIDLKTGWLTYPRGKTGIMRRIPLWPETIAAVKDWLTQRPTPKDPENFGLAFITVRGNPWDKGTGDRAITHECRKLLDELKIAGNRNFYALRHTLETIAGESRDQIAVDAIMGHAREDMLSVYRERISDGRLQAVVEFVRTWLFAKPEAEGQKKPLLKIAEEEGDAAIA